jgi:hypothetical protein
VLFLQAMVTLQSFKEQAEGAQKLSKLYLQRLVHQHPSGNCRNLQTVKRLCISMLLWVVAHGF